MWPSQKIWTLCQIRKYIEYLARFSEFPWIEKIDDISIAYLFRALPEYMPSCVTVMCGNDELNSTMTWVGCLLKDTELFIQFAENSQILLKISVIPILLTFIYLVALNLLVNNQRNSSLQHIIVTYDLTFGAQSGRSAILHIQRNTYRFTKNLMGVK